MKGRWWVSLATCTLALVVASAQAQTDADAIPNQGSTPAVLEPIAPKAKSVMPAADDKGVKGSTAAPLYNGSTHCSDSVICADDCCEPCGLPGRFWARADYLNWRTRGQQYPVLITTSPEGTPNRAPDGTPIAGVPGLSTTTVLLGGERGDSNARNGLMFTAGAWLNDCRTLGIEARYFQLQTQADSFEANSNTFPILISPFTDELGQPQRFAIGFPEFASGSVNLTNSSRFYGGDIHALINLCCSCNCRVDALVGYRHLRLNEDLRIRDIETFIPDQSTIDATDDFNTRNRFNGADLGIVAQYFSCKWTVDVGARVALGVTEREVSINGSSTFIQPGIDPITRVGGIRAQASNIGTQSDDQFTAIPEFSVNFGYRLTCNLRALVGYTFIYWPDVARSGDQIDNTLNLSQFPSSTSPGGLSSLVGAARPAAQINESNYWAHGFNLGLEFRY